ncbi:putative spermidine/putrescine transport system ATP-binding protein/spermidine/putrescine transport system ATP-binding protein [Rhizobium giardinii]|uniref:Putative spermidine/putrescine transport system ATP-binding protein/spermidine/putrescine transport system ATP-binding protein n=1 Tax=Rhizobium giardinii TaxID=56731 RepID=A0A7W8UBF8_9HYPH|nr:putative spermidine/putrescine transport system ATP-binding protein/spermidine/putrescine transport system ATP-binding protein [Rhizobium giardinii]
MIQDLNLEIPRGEFVSILGPSGCGKTTTLNMIAGFNTPSLGDIRIRGRSQTRVPPERRNLGLVFQNYALFPHMTVADNVGFGLRMRSTPKAEIEPAVQAALRSVRLDGLGGRYPKALSGGQQQRVALARAIAPRPTVLLLDEPLSNLDLKLREAMRIELKEIHEQLGMTFVYVTHDQEEAMAMSDRIVVMWQGAIAQQGKPDSIYRSPATRFVADFIGRSNVLSVSKSAREAPFLHLTLEGSPIVLRSACVGGAQTIRSCCIRPECIVLLEETQADIVGQNQFDGVVRRIVNLGAHIELLVEIADGLRLTVLIRSGRSSFPPEPGSTVTLGVDPHDVQLLAD